MAASVLRWWVRLSGLVQLVLGGLFWIGSQLQLIPLHMLNGVLLVLGLWALAGIAAVARVDVRWVAAAVVWGVLTVALGMTQAQILPGDVHWVVRVVHLLVGLAAVGQSEGLARRIKTRPDRRVAARAVGGAV
ncbi:MAG TPA: hypothetical protein VFC93_09755 [Chloroflexota bacterium]|nr:hypothetical protein [Chloroflexota bacterium]